MAKEFALKASPQLWTRSQRIRTTAEVPFEAVLLEAADPPLYQRIAVEATRLHRLGLSDVRITQSLGVSDKTVAKALVWSVRFDG